MGQLFGKNYAWKVLEWFTLSYILIHRIYFVVSVSINESAKRKQTFEQKVVLELLTVSLADQTPKYPGAMFHKKEIYEH